MSSLAFGPGTAYVGLDTHHVTDELDVGIFRYDFRWKVREIISGSGAWVERAKRD